MARVGPVVASVIGWTVGAAAAVSVGMVALSLVGNNLADDPLASSGVGTVATPPPNPSATVRATTPATTPPSGKPTSTPTTSPRTVNSRGGTVVATCRPGGAYLLYWSPAPGFRAEDVARGPSTTAHLTFEAPGREVKVSVRCVDGVPHPTVDEED